MKLPLDLPRLVAGQLGRGPISLPVSIDIDMFLEYSELDDTELDLHELLREHRMIGHFYTVDDVTHLRPHLTDDQAWQVLQAIETSVQLAPEYGMSWDGIRDTADSLFPSREKAFVATVTVSIETDKVLSQDDAHQLYAEIERDINHRHRYVHARYDRSSLQTVDVPSQGGQS
jgi:hypothetical protein